jgi:hypothetical protein
MFCVMLVPEIAAYNMRGQRMSVQFGPRHRGGAEQRAGNRQRVQDRDPRRIAIVRLTNQAAEQYRIAALDADRFSGSGG